MSGSSFSWERVTLQIFLKGFILLFAEAADSDNRQGKGIRLTGFDQYGNSDPATHFTQGER